LFSRLESFDSIVVIELSSYLYRFCRKFAEESGGIFGYIDFSLGGGEGKLGGDTVSVLGTEAAVPRSFP
jgi:hypothetical protein